MTTVIKTFSGTNVMSTESSEMRISRIQSNRLRLAGVLTLMSLIEWAVTCMGYYVEIPLWLMIANIVCLMFNMPLIWWLMSLWWEQRKRDKEIRKQANYRR